MTEAREIRAKDRGQWRRWLQRHSAREKKVWLVIYKQGSGVRGISYAEAVEEALCFGWIDSRANPVDAQSFKQQFSERKAGSPWSGANKRRIRQLIADGRMTERGLAKIEAAKRDGSWTSYDAAETLEPPPDLARAFRRNAAARRHFEAFPPSARKAILWWIARAKRPETRAKRVAETVRRAATNERANEPSKQK